MTQDKRALASASLAPLAASLITQYYREGFLLLPPTFLPRDTLSLIASAMPAAVADNSPRRVLERDGNTVRSVYGLHQTSTTIADVTRTPSLLGAIRQIIGDEVYVHQSKINLKAPFVGDQWEWHQDYIYWLQGDGIQKPDLVNAAIFLDEVTEFNGPLTFISGSHRQGVLAGTESEGMPEGYEDAPTWVATLTADEKFQVSATIIEGLASSNGLVSPKGPAGSVLLFHPNILHASAPNISPFRRAVLLLVYNSVSNSAHVVPQQRPSFLAEPDVRPLMPLPSTVTSG
jgi:ectoine hydroxylase